MDQWANIEERLRRFEEVDIGEGVHERHHAVGERLIERYAG